MYGFKNIVLLVDVAKMCYVATAVLFNFFSGFKLYCVFIGVSEAFNLVVIVDVERETRSLLFVGTMGVLKVQRRLAHWHTGTNTRRQNKTSPISGG